MAKKDVTAEMIASLTKALVYDSPVSVNGKIVYDQITKGIVIGLTLAADPDSVEILMGDDVKDDVYGLSKAIDRKRMGVAVELQEVALAIAPADSEDDELPSDIRKASVKKKATAPVKKKAATKKAPPPEDDDDSEDEAEEPAPKKKAPVKKKAPPPVEDDDDFDDFDDFDDDDEEDKIGRAHV